MKKKTTKIKGTGIEVISKMSKRRPASKLRPKSINQKEAVNVLKELADIQDTKLPNVFNYTLVELDNGNAAGAINCHGQSIFKATLAMIETAEQNEPGVKSALISKLLLDKLTK